MELTTEAFLVQTCLQQIEQQLGWGNSQDWSTQDFERLSVLIQEKTKVQLSIITLKRIWGKIRYDSRPTITTLNALAQFIGFENWRAFRQAHQQTNQNNGHTNSALDAANQPTPQPRLQRQLLRLAGALMLTAVLVAGVYFFWKAQPLPVSTGEYSFSSKKVVDTGIPNTVIFDYDATAANPQDSIFIQQTWDARLSRQVGREQKTHTSIYYYPGYFQAKLRVNEQVVKEHNLFIKTNGWLPLVEQTPIPVYFEKVESIQQGYMGLTEAQLREKNIQLQPHTPWMGFYHVVDLPDARIHDYIFEAELKNDYREGAAACQHTEVHLLFQGATLIIPLSIPGCVSELTFRDRDGKKSDLSAFGVDFSNWVTVRAELIDSIGRVFVNGKKADEFPVQVDALPSAGVIFKFKGIGSVKSLRMEKENGEVVYQEQF